MFEHAESPIILIVGTRPEGIKMAPVYHALKRAGIPTILCATMQHGELLQEVFDLFKIKPDIELNIMRHGQDLFYVTQAVLQKTKEVFLSVQPSLIMVQGDTTSSMAAALAAFYLGIPVAHIEAGLRTDDIQMPFPEEMNRRVISMIAAYHFAPTASAVANLLSHGIHRDTIFCTGNTIVDAMHSIKDKIQRKEVHIRQDIYDRILKAQISDHEIGLLTVHRRESFNGPIDAILHTMKEWCLAHPDIVWFYPFHPNPSVVAAIQNAGLDNLPNLILCEPLNYKDLVYILDSATYILTDSGGIQEEAISMGKHVLVLREKTERMEGVLVGLARIVGSDPQEIWDGLSWIASANHSISKHIPYIYGDGHAAEKIVAFIQVHYDQLLQNSVERLPIHNDEMMPTQKEFQMKKICVVGLGYIGLPTAIIAAEAGYEVVGFDIDEQKIARISKGDPIIHEPDAYEKLQYVLASKQLTVQSTITDADYYIIAVPTPIHEDKKPDLSYLYTALETICSVIKPGNTIIIESTIPVGFSQNAASFVSEKTNLKSGKDFFVAHCPERVLPGNIFYELTTNDRIIGGVDEPSLQAAKAFYEPFVSGHLYQTNSRVAEMVKLVENSSRDVQLAFAHEVDTIAQKAGLNSYEIIALANKHPRVNILRPTCGVGGHCIAVDPWFLIDTFQQESSLMKAARIVNDSKPFEVVRRIKAAAAQWSQMYNAVCSVNIFGLTYKPNVDDLRESPALKVAQMLSNDSTISLTVTDPFVDRHVLETLFTNRVRSSSQGIKEAHVLVFLVAHDRFKIINKAEMSTKKIMDFCGLFYEQRSAEQGQPKEIWSNPSMIDFFIANQPSEG